MKQAQRLRANIAIIRSSAYMSMFQNGEHIHRTALLRAKLVKPYMKRRAKANESGTKFTERFPTLTDLIRRTQWTR